MLGAFEIEQDSNGSQMNKRAESESGLQLENSSRLEITNSLSRLAVGIAVGYRTNSRGDFQFMMKP